MLYTLSSTAHRGRWKLTLEGKTVLVTGGTGFLGGAVVRRLGAEPGVKVHALVRNLQRAQEFLKWENVEVIPGDLGSPHSLTEAVKDCQIVIHSAAALKGSLEEQLCANREGTRSLALAAAEAGVERFVHISTISVYGYRNTRDVTEETPPYPGRDPYGVSKLAAEVALKQIAAERGLAYTVIRPGMIYGPRSGMWTGQMFKVARRSPTIFIGSGSGSCYPIHVEDVVDLILLAATHPNAIGETFNCTPDPSPTWREFLGEYAKLAEHSSWFGIPPFLLVPVAALAGRFAPESSPLRDLPDLVPFSQRYITYSTDKACHLLGWKPKISLKEGIAGCADWLREKGLLKLS
jgi:2-alkyl-3-oxoalkanoate reductase